MVCQGSFCYKGLTLRHFVVSSISVKRARMINWKSCVKCCVVVFITSKFISNIEHLWTALTFCFHLKKTAPESYRLLREAYGERGPSQDTCERWFQRFKNGDFDTRQERIQETWENLKKI